MAVDRNHQGKGCAFPECPSFGHLLVPACCFPCCCRWCGGRKSQEVLWTFRIFPNKRNGHETCSFYRRYSKIIRGSLSWQRLLLANCFMPFVTDDSFHNLFNMWLSGKSGKKAVLSKPEPAREPILYFVISVVFRPASSWKISAKILDNQKSIRLKESGFGDCTEKEVRLETHVHQPHIIYIKGSFGLFVWTIF